VLDTQNLAPSQGKRLPATQEEMRALAELALNHARTLGASATEVEVSASLGQTVTVRMREVETIEHNRDKGLSITVYFGQQRGSASTSDFARAAIERTVAAACTIAKYTAADEFAGLADPDQLAREPIPDLHLYEPWPVTVEEAIRLATETEAAAFAVDKRIDNSEGATLSTEESNFIYANSNGFMAGYPTSRASLSASVIATSGDAMQRDYWFTTARGAAGIESPEAVGRKAGERCVARLGARRIGTCVIPVLFDPNMASGLISQFVSAVSGSSLYRKASFLLDSLGKPVFSSSVTLREEPHLPGGLASGYFDAEGVATRTRDVVRDGAVCGYFLGSYSARKLGMQTTGNAGGNHNLILQPGEHDLPGLLRKMQRGLLVTELMGQGVNGVTGDYSRGAVGFWVEGGEIQFPVEEVTIAGNLKDMYRNIVAVGNDVLVTGSRQTGSILVESMAIAGD
jgi:PmbA protein